MDKDQKNKDNKKKSDANETQKKSQDAKPHAQKHNDVKEEKSNNNSEVETLRAKVELLENELNQTKDKALRALADAENTIKESIDEMRIKEADYFMREFIPAYMLTLDKSGNEN